MTSRGLRAHCALDEEGKGLLKGAMEALGLSARAHHRRPGGVGGRQAGHVTEAIGYRTLDRKLWAR